ncbi:MAG: hypothetical protein P4M11_07885 [Candidatus Pacebacteria bacterium]|nr:hypothetical protein [Candidatus Paceibacterota bacterium]
MLESGREHLVNSYKVLELTHQDFKSLLKGLKDYIDQIAAELELRKTTKSLAKAAITSA